MTRDDMSDEQALALDRLIDCATTLGGATNEHAHRRAMCDLRSAESAFLATLSSAPRSLAAALNAHHDYSTEPQPQEQ